MSYAPGRAERKEAVNIVVRILDAGALVCFGYLLYLVFLAARDELRRFNDREEGKK